MTHSTTRAWGFFFVGTAVGLIVGSLSNMPDGVLIWGRFGLAVGGVILLISTSKGEI